MLRFAFRLFLVYFLIGSGVQLSAAETTGPYTLMAAPKFENPIDKIRVFQGKDHLYFVSKNRDFYFQVQANVSRADTGSGMGFSVSAIGFPDQAGKLTFYKPDMPYNYQKLAPKMDEFLQQNKISAFYSLTELPESEFWTDAPGAMSYIGDIDFADFKDHAAYLTKWGLADEDYAYLYSALFSKPAESFRYGEPTSKKSARGTARFFSYPAPANSEKATDSQTKNMETLIKNPLKSGFNGYSAALAEARNVRNKYREAKESNLLFSLAVVGTREEKQMSGLKNDLQNAVVNQIVESAQKLEKQDPELTKLFFAFISNNFQEFVVPAQARLQVKKLDTPCP